MSHFLCAFSSQHLINKLYRSLLSCLCYAASRANATNSAVTALQSRLDDTQSQLDEALKASNQKSELIDGLRSELTAACRGVEGLGVVIQYLSRAIDNTRQELGN